MSNQVHFVIIPERTSFAFNAGNLAGYHATQHLDDEARAI
jgi:hypothetical protein